MKLKNNTKRETLILRYRAEKQQVKCDLEYHKKQIEILEQQEILLDEIIKDLHFLEVEDVKDKM